MALTRRSLLTAATAGALAPVLPGVRLAFGATPGNNVLVVIFLRFGMDGLQLLAPAEDASYRAKRASVGLRPAGTALGAMGDTPFYLHPQAGQLRLMYNAKTLAFVHAAGTPTDLRSHFEVQAMVDKGIAGTEVDPSSGWLTRHLLARGLHSDFAATADTMTDSSSLSGTSGVLPTSSLTSLPYSISQDQAALIGVLNAGDNAVAQSARETLKTIAVVREKTAGLKQTTSPNYSYGALSQKLQPLATAIKLDLGIQAAILDFEGWDHHENIAYNFSNQITEFSNALFAFTDDLGDAMSRVTVVTVTEFGRRVQENASAGTDHGAGSVMIALGAGINGGKIYGQWPGLADEQLDQGDLRVTTDLRQVLGELLVKRQGQTAIQSVFPNITYSPLGIASAI
jgi:uncharacterized protein (DUF1501 family)